MILLVNVCFEKLHYLEFVKPLENILKKDFFTKHFSELTDKDLICADKIIICGTGLKDDYYLEKINDFSWIKKINKPIFGICAGFQIIGLVYSCELKKKLEIGYFSENFKENFLGLTGKQEVYHLHNNYVNFSDEFIKFTNGKIVQAIKHKRKDIYGTLFHPEVRNKEIILNFVNL